MATSKKSIGYDIGTVIADVLGWVFLMGWLIGSYGVGVLVAKFLGLADQAQSIGLLSALAVIWMYEHRLANDRWERYINRPN
jgi:hypothetical protein